MAGDTIAKVHIRTATRLGPETTMHTEGLNSAYQGHNHRDSEKDRGLSIERRYAILFDKDVTGGNDADRSKDRSSGNSNANIAKRAFGRVFSAFAQNLEVLL